ncbi:hypothetical protein D9M71_605020 [compost metagenome]
MRATAASYGCKAYWAMTAPPVTNWWSTTVPWLGPRPLPSATLAARAPPPCKTVFKLSKPKARPSATVAPSDSKPRCRSARLIIDYSRGASLPAAQTAGTCVRPLLRRRWLQRQCPIPIQPCRPSWCLWCRYRWRLSAHHPCRRPLPVRRPFPCTARKSRSGQCCLRRSRSWP